MTIENPKCDFGLVHKGKGAGLYSFPVPDDDSEKFVLICRDCLAELVRREFAKKTA